MRVKGGSKRLDTVLEKWQGTMRRYCREGTRKLFKEYKKKCPVPSLKKALWIQEERLPDGIRLTIEPRYGDSETIQKILWVDKGRRAITVPSRARTGRYPLKVKKWISHRRIKKDGQIVEEKEVKKMSKRAREKFKKERYVIRAPPIREVKPTHFLTKIFQETLPNFVNRMPIEAAGRLQKIIKREPLGRGE